MENTSEVEVCMKIPFPTARHAEIAFDVLRIDSEPKRNSVKKNLKLENNLLIVELYGDQVKNVRVSLTSFFDTLILCCETMDTFGPPISDKYEFY